MYESAGLTSTRFETTHRFQTNGVCATTVPWLRGMFSKPLFVDLARKIWLYEEFTVDNKKTAPADQGLRRLGTPRLPRPPPRRRRMPSQGLQIMRAAAIAYSMERTKTYPGFAIMNNFEGPV